MKREESNDIYIIYILKQGTSAFKYLLSKWLVIFVVAIVFASLGVLYAWMQRPAYVAELVFSTESGDNNVGGYLSLAASFGLDIGGSRGGAFEGDNLMELLRSQKIVEQTLLSDAPNFGKDKLMIDAYVVNHQMDKNWSKDKKMRGIRFEKDPSAPNRIRDSITKAIYKGIVETQLSIDKKDKKLNYIVVRMKDVDETFSKDFVEALVDNATKYYVEYKSRKARKNFQLVNKLTDFVRNLLYGNIESYAQSTDLNVNALRQVAKTPGQRAQINAQANTAAYTELVKQLGLSQITLQKETPLIQVIDEPILPLKNEKPGRLKTGIIFGFFGTLAFCVLLLVIRWLKTEYKQDKVSLAAA